MHVVYKTEKKGVIWQEKLVPKQIFTINVNLIYAIPDQNTSMIYLYNQTLTIVHGYVNVFMIGDLSGIVQMFNDHLPQKNKIYLQFVSPLQKYVRVFNHLLLPSSRLWNAYIQFRGCDWRRASKGFIPTARKGPPVADKPVTSLGSHSNK